MEHIWSPWRYQYVTGAARSHGCVFCQVVIENEDARNHIVYRDQLNYIILNLYPYTAGHLMIVPYLHEPSITGLDVATSSEMMELSKRSVKALEDLYHPEGFNLGFNLGRCAGAGVAEHVHFHVVPRWFGDANFMSTIGETRTLPEDLDVTYKKLKKYF